MNETEVVYLFLPQNRAHLLGQIFMPYNEF